VCCTSICARLVFLRSSLLDCQSIEPLQLCVPISLAAGLKLGRGLGIGWSLRSGSSRSSCSASSTPKHRLRNCCFFSCQRKKSILFLAPTHSYVLSSCPGSFSDFFGLNKVGLLCFQMEKVGLKPYTEWLLKRRAASLSSKYPKYHKAIIEDYSSDTGLFL